MNRRSSANGYAMAMDADALRAEIQVNYDAFQRALATLLPGQQNRYALLRHGEVIDFFARPGQADLAGSQRFADGLYSIQQVIDEPVELGVYANVAD